MDDGSRDEFAASFAAFVDRVTTEDRQEIREIAASIAQDAVDVVWEGGDDADEIHAQMRALFEEHRIEVVAGGWDFIGDALRMAIASAKVFA